MKNRKRMGNLLIAMGLLLVLAALLLVTRNRWEEREGGEEASHILTVLQEEIPQAETGPSEPAEEEAPAEEEPEEAELPEYILNPDMEMPTQEIEGNAYIGVLEFPSLGLSLPIMSEWSYSKLKIAPCRYSGSVYTGSMTIAGHNYSTHFGPICNLAVGDEVIFTDVEGNRFTYRVQALETLEPTAIEDMLSDEWDLSLFTCTIDGQARLTVRCLKEE